MSLTETTDRGQTDALSFELDLAHPPEKVWRALTIPALLEEWLLPVIGFAPEPGTAFTFKTDPQPGWDGTVDCRVLDVEPKKSMRFRWVVGDIDTVVALTLRPTDAGTCLEVVQSGFRPDQKQNFGGARYGWKMMGGKLIALLDRL